jgi:peptidoglycan hydrolase-like protein with peptidoglycan-binding domain
MMRNSLRPTVGARALCALAALVMFGCHAREVEAPAAEPSAALEQDPAMAGDTQTGGAIFRDGAIEFIQSALQKKGYTVHITGKLDDATTTALLAFQKEENLARTGLPDHETLRRLGLEPEALYLERDESK